jgi:hypothetical protein
MRRQRETGEGSGEAGPRTRRRAADAKKEEESPQEIITRTGTKRQATADDGKDEPEQKIVRRA